MAERTLPGVADDELVGEVAHVVFTNPASGFGVVELVAGEGDEPPRAAGPLAGLVAGQPVRLVGAWTRHPRHGRTFDAVYYELATPERAEALRAFLASRRFPGVGDTIADRIVSAFGLELPQVLAREPEALVRVRGVSAELARRIGAAWAEAGALAALVGRLGATGVPATVAQASFRTLGDDAGKRLDEDPYHLLEVPGATWAHAESLARAAGVDADDDRRLAAGAASAHAARRRRGGHVAVANATLLTDTARVLETDEPTTRAALRLAVQRERLGVEDDEALVDDEPRWYAPADLVAERRLAADLARIAQARSRVAAATGTHAEATGSHAEPTGGHAEATGTHAEPTGGQATASASEGALTPEQAFAVQAALTEPVSVLTGGPGTGKTRTVVEVVAACEAADLRVACAAPTGRAAKRLEELTGRPATTVHRLLDAQPRRGGGFRFGYGSDRRLPHDLVVADEWSMADLHLAAALAAAVDGGAHLLLVGDADQLPSVGAGAVLRDLLDAADAGAALTATRLTTIHRQAAESRIVTLAHEINAGEVTPPRGRDGDVFAVPERGRAVADRVAAIVSERAPSFFGCPSSDVQVLAPMYRGPAGVDALNAALKETLNPAGGRPPVLGFHEGDRVVQTRNDAELEVANGDVGEVIACNRADETIEVAFPHGTAVYDDEQAADLRPAWCLTVHKSQGGEWPVVVLVLDAGHRVMHFRELVYTAVTRAREGLLLVGDPRLLVAAARRSGSGARERETLLLERLLAPDPALRLGDDASGE